MFISWHWLHCELRRDLLEYKWQRTSLNDGVSAALLLLTALWARSAPDFKHLSDAFEWFLLTSGSHTTEPNPTKADLLIIMMFALERRVPCWLEASHWYTALSDALVLCNTIVSPKTLLLGAGESADSKTSAQLEHGGTHTSTQSKQERPICGCPQSEICHISENCRSMFTFIHSQVSNDFTKCSWHFVTFSLVWRSNWTWGGN